MTVPMLGLLTSDTLVNQEKYGKKNTQEVAQKPINTGL
jgi:hypothetical protein